MKIQIAWIYPDLKIFVCRIISKSCVKVNEVFSFEKDALICHTLHNLKSKLTGLKDIDQIFKRSYC